MDKQRPNKNILNPWRSEIPHLFGPEQENMVKQRQKNIILNSEPESMDKQRPEKIILNPWWSQIPHLFGPEPENMDK